jgi:hypothetical protein
MSPSIRSLEYIAMSEVELLEDPTTEAKGEATDVADSVEFIDAPSQTEPANQIDPVPDEALSNAIADQVTAAPAEIADEIPLVEDDGIAAQSSAPVEEEVIAGPIASEDAPVADELTASDVVSEAAPVEDAASTNEVELEAAPVAEMVITNDVASEAARVEDAAITNEVELEAAPVAEMVITNEVASEAVPVEEEAIAAEVAPVEDEPASLAEPVATA